MRPGAYLGRPKPRMPAVRLCPEPPAPLSGQFVTACPPTKGRQLPHTRPSDKRPVIGSDKTLLRLLFMAPNIVRSTLRQPSAAMPPRFQPCPTRPARSSPPSDDEYGVAPHQPDTTALPRPDSGCPHGRKRSGTCMPAQTGSDECAALRSSVPHRAQNWLDTLSRKTPPGKSRLANLPTSLPSSRAAQVASSGAGNRSALLRWNDRSFGHWSPDRLAGLADACRRRIGRPFRSSRLGTTTCVCSTGVPNDFLQDRLQRIAPEQSPTVIALGSADRNANGSCHQRRAFCKTSPTDRGQTVHPIRVKFLAAQLFDRTGTRPGISAKHLSAEPCRVSAPVA